jgi:hypothetical protein
VRSNGWTTRVASSIGLACVLACSLGCGVSSASPNTSAKTYLYVGQTPLNLPPLGVPTGSVTQYRLESDGTLTSLDVSSTGSVIPLSAAVSPSDQYYFALDAAFGISEFGIGSNGILGANTTPAVTGSAIGFTPNGQFAIIANPSNYS